MSKVRNKHLRKAILAENSATIVHQKERADGIQEEHYNDDSKRFSGTGGGVLWILANDTAVVMPVERIRAQRVCFLMEVAKLMPQSPIGIEDVERYKEESRMMLEALRSGDAQFFRDLGDAIKPRKSATKTSKRKGSSRQKTDGEILGFILSAATAASEVPDFEEVFALYRGTKEYRSDTRQQLKKKLKRLGFAWIFTS